MYDVEPCGGCSEPLELTKRSDTLSGHLFGIVTWEMSAQEVIQNGSGAVEDPARLAREVQVTHDVIAVLSAALTEARNIECPLLPERTDCPKVISLERIAENLRELDGRTQS